MSQAPRWVAGVRAAVGTPEVGRQVAGLLPAVTTNLPEVEPTPAIGAQPKASLMDKGRAHPCLMGGRAFAFLARISQRGFGRPGQLPGATTAYPRVRSFGVRQLAAAFLPASLLAGTFNSRTNHQPPSWLVQEQQQAAHSKAPHPRPIGRQRRGGSGKVGGRKFQLRKSPCPRNPPPRCGRHWCQPKWHSGPVPRGLHPGLSPR